MTFLIERKNSLLIVSGPPHDPDRKHLYVILTNPKNDPATRLLSTLIVPICSIVDGKRHDPACLLGKGDHPFLRHDSYADYYRALIESIDTLTRGIADGKIIAKVAITDDSFAYLCKGLIDSKRTSPKNLLFFHNK